MVYDGQLVVDDGFHPALVTGVHSCSWWLIGFQWWLMNDNLWKSWFLLKCLMMFGHWWVMMVDNGPWWYRWITLGPELWWRGFQDGQATKLLMVGWWQLMMICSEFIVDDSSQWMVNIWRGLVMDGNGSSWLYHAWWSWWYWLGMAMFTEQRICAMVDYNPQPWYWWWRMMGMVTGCGTHDDCGAVDTDMRGSFWLNQSIYDGIPLLHITSDDYDDNSSSW